MHLALLLLMFGRVEVKVDPAFCKVKKLERCSINDTGKIRCATVVLDCAKYELVGK